ncbi:hypothetical protein AYL99_09797 [Fonsecaea erecta]|uniref:Uncharacterized protein n=1 Tax=Fonsecaea erecta TaxID=1367422 RepID=A0A178Z9C5_9EURO|nr:hypothetical protein AYL99_09797 [Fonsecaea erecta]OAP55645.1 hypothetical protein AYL99_09797 [Fonsecaea erecta]
MTFLTLTFTTTLTLTTITLSRPDATSKSSPTASSKCCVKLSALDDVALFNKLHVAYPKPALSRQRRDISSAPQSSRSLDDKLNYFNKELTATKSEVTNLIGSLQKQEGKADSKFIRLESEMTSLKSEMTSLKSEMGHLNENLTMQMKSFTETMSAQISVLNANMESRLDKFENRFLFGMVFAIFSVSVVAIGGTVAATFKRSPNRTD